MNEPITIDEMLEWLGSGCPFCADVSDDPHYLAIRAILEQHKHLPENAVMISKAQLSVLLEKAGEGE